MSFRALLSVVAALVGLSVLACSTGNKQVVESGSQAEDGEEPTEQADPVQKTSTGDEQASAPRPSPQECDKARQPCDACDEVERARRKIVRKKCADTCDAYIEKHDELTTIESEQVVSILKREAVCGKKRTTCSVKRETACGHALGYATAGQKFNRWWVSDDSVPPAGELMTKYHDLYVRPFVDTHLVLWKWAETNTYDPATTMKAGAEIMKLRDQTIRDEFSGEIGSAIRNSDGKEKKELERMWRALEELRDAVAEPGASYEAFESRVEKASSVFPKKTAAK